jgi:DNA (cytosine-5)-methyltransferase 1
MEGTSAVTLKVVSLFSGCGGMDLGIEGGFNFLNKRYRETGFKVIQAIDFDRRVVDIYNRNFKLKCEIKDIISTPTDYFKEHDVLIGGFPCQSFSIVAQNPKRLGYKDDKGKLFFEICRLLRNFQPKVFIAENVKGLLSANKGEAFNLIIKEFENCGYHVTYKLLNSSDFGIPQKRERVFIIGFKEKKAFEEFQFPVPTTPKPKSKVTLRDVIQDEDDQNEKLYFSEKAVLGLKKTKHLLTMNKGRAQDLDAPCNTVGAHLAKVSLNSTDPVLMTGSRYRMFSPREVARIQSFPDNFELAPSKTWNYVALGNAVPPVMIWHVANCVVKVF